MKGSSSVFRLEHSNSRSNKTKGTRQQFRQPHKELRRYQCCWRQQQQWVRRVLLLPFPARPPYPSLPHPTRSPLCGSCTRRRANERNLFECRRSEKL